MGVWTCLLKKLESKALETRQHFGSITFPNSALLAQKNHCAQHVPSHLAEHFSGEAFVRNPPNKIQWTTFCSSSRAQNLQESRGFIMAPTFRQGKSLSNKINTHTVNCSPAALFKRGENNDVKFIPNSDPYVGF